ncbi:hypothetical protein B0T26DRAFT_819342 [Lasiosphaeria miniovina]|uniref:Nascent polypeptide-associated complex subunit alpha-like UBA domain-containing protein n=1 Tax=Lasiosphaeria miniovina TaxID=1954250 RepID=A0AA40BHG6_9PEZI|nr:uncharacterized protein B0T26DRAFT_819342 [Lasiosphaeria miniovina]KAK0734319.1 hypothetical protein B0T26DRAFT_819342 [Lasiosphaeria miniovina]
MAEDRQPANIVAGAAVDVDDEIDPAVAAAKSAEDRKAAAALSKLDTHGEDDAGPAREVDQEAVLNAMNSLGAGGGGKEALRRVKVDAADVALLVDELDLSKAKATELLKAHEGDAVRAMRAFITPVF